MKNYNNKNNDNNKNKKRSYGFNSKDTNLKARVFLFYYRLRL